MTPPHYVLTGGPCAGKTTTIEELKKRGYTVLPEAARTVIDAQLAAGKTIQDVIADPLWLQHAIITHQIELLAQAPKEKTVFIDRGIPDNVAYYRKFGLAFDDMLNNAVEPRLYRKIFLLAMIDFVTDAARYETPEEAQKLHEGIRQAYTELKYEIVEVPVMPVGERADFIVANL